MDKTEHFKEDPESALNKLREEYKYIQSRKGILQDHTEILKEIFITVKNRLEIDPLITEKIKLKTRKNDDTCCYLF